MAAAIVVIGATLLATVQPTAAATRVVLTGAGDIVITGDNGPQVVIVKVVNQTILITVETGQDSVEYAYSGPVRDVKINLRGGNDGFHVYDVSTRLASRDLIVNLGSGHNHSELHDISLNRNFRFTDGSGSGTLEMSQVSVEGKTWINMGGGSNLLRQSTGTHFKDVVVSTAGSGSLDLDTTDLNFVAAYRLTTGNKVDELSYRNTILQGKVTINTRGGNDLINLRSNTDLGNGADIRMGSGADRATLFNTTVSGSFRFRGESGNDVLSISAGRYNNAVALEGGGGRDQLTGEATVFVVPPKVIGFEVR